jgi:hypothetical protein
MDDETLKEIDYKLNKIKRHLVRITDAVEDICAERYHLEILIHQVRDTLAQQIKEQNNDK